MITVLTSARTRRGPPLPPKRVAVATSDFTVHVAWVRASEEPPALPSLDAVSVTGFSIHVEYTPS